MKLWKWIKYRWKRWQMENEMDILFELSCACRADRKLQKRFDDELQEKLVVYKKLLRDNNAL